MDDSILNPGYIVLLALAALAVWVIFRLIGERKPAAEERETRKAPVARAARSKAAPKEKAAPLVEEEEELGNPPSLEPIEETNPPASPVPPSLPSAPAVSSAPTAVSVNPSATPVSSPAEPRAKAVFISYRRQDSPHITGRIYDRLAAQFGRELIFKDVDSIPLGFDFRQHLREQVGRCGVLIAVIGRNWNPATESGELRMSDPRDYLRIEVESALERHVPVIPVLVDGIEMPLEKDLPATLANLAYHNGISVRHDPDFHHDMDRLVRGIEQILN